MEDERWCWWPVGQFPGGGGGIACGRRATAERIHPESGQPVALCAEHEEHFDEALELGASL